MEELSLTNEQLVEICELAEEVQAGQRGIDPKQLALAVQVVALCLHRSQASNPPDSGPGVDEWYDKEIGQKVRMMWLKVKPAAEKLKAIGLLKA